MTVESMGAWTARLASPESCTVAVQSMFALSRARLPAAELASSCSLEFGLCLLLAEECLNLVSHSGLSLLYSLNLISYFLLSSTILNFLSFYLNLKSICWGSLSSDLLVLSSSIVFLLCWLPLRSPGFCLTQHCKIGYFVEAMLGIVRMNTH